MEQRIIITIGAQDIINNKKQINFKTKKIYNYENEQNNQKYSCHDGHLLRRKHFFLQKRR
jgi:hypothetical protein